MNDSVEKLLNELICDQKKKLLSIARKFINHITQEDLLQPQDYPELDNDPDFRYEEGVLCGMESALFAIRAELNDT